ncbi:hypothetical protein GCM10009678_73510 [Actinomadura kijaniata]|uniref:Uncharacterized protein n=1 Tax=Actinomadura namibiensis TaxID=182080 RepID=A0A7W3QP29_ACTNM|nr:DUF5946 family protein [Actinomadura namibiensis]MBA8954250.1 hypothetical protein [Actinomadura namibiensis]
MTHCPECGAPAEPRSCEELFHALLALDHSRRPPWGPLHGVSVSCFLLQHPSRIPGPDAAPPWSLLHAYLRDGLDGADRRVRHVRRGDSHRGPGGAPAAAPGVAAPALDRPPARFAVTIAEVAGGGDFPAEGFAERVRDWAAATVDAWTSRPG